MVTKSYIENTAPCYKQEIKQDMIDNVKNFYILYSNQNNDTDINNNEAGPSGVSREELVEENMNTEIKYQEDKIKWNNESAKKLIEEVQQGKESGQKVIFMYGIHKNNKYIYDLTSDYYIKVFLIWINFSSYVCIYEICRCIRKKQWIYKI